MITSLEKVHGVNYSIQIDITFYISHELLVAAQNIFSAMKKCMYAIII